MEIVWVCLHNQGLPTTSSMAQQSGDSQGVTCGKLDADILKKKPRDLIGKKEGSNFLLGVQH